jgi:hypothetical protein
MYYNKLLRLQDKRLIKTDLREFDDETKEMVSKGAWERCILWSWIICSPQQIFDNDQVGDDELCGGCSTHSTGRTTYKVLVGTAEGSNWLEDISEARRKLLKWVFGKWFGRVCSGCIWFIIWGPVTGFCEHGNETLGSLN